MSMNLAVLVGEELHRLLRPLTNIAYGREPLVELRRLLRGCGWTVTAEVQAQAVIDVIDDVVGTVETFLEDPIPDDFQEAIDRLQQITDLIENLRGLGQTLAELDNGPPPTADAVAALTEDLLHHLAVSWLQSKADLVAATELIGLTSQVEVPEMTMGWLKRLPGRQRRVQLSVFPTILQDPGGYLLGRLAPHGWSEPEQVQATMVAVLVVLGPLLAPRGYQPHVMPRAAQPDPRQAAADLVRPSFELTLPSRPGVPGAVLVVDVEAIAASENLPAGGSGPGLAIWPSGGAGFAAEVLGWDLSIAANLDTDDEAIELTPSGVSFDPDVALDFSLLATRQLDLVLGLNRTGLTLGRLEIGADVAVSVGEQPELRLEAVVRDSEVGISTSDFGSAVAKILPLELAIPFDLGLAWSNVSGLSVSGSAGLEITLANEISLANGAFVFRDILLGVEIEGEADGAPGIALGISGDIDFTLTEFAATVEGIGLKSEITFPPGGGNMGQAHLSFGLDLPETLGLSVNLPAVTGGGLIMIDHEIGRYAGAVSIQIISVGISAITVIDTQLPGQDDGWAFFAVLTLEFPAIPLGFGFTLSGVGGLVAINRGIDTFAIAAGLKSGVVDSLLFPDDPVNDAAELIGMIDEYFPILPGNTVFGPIVELGWGAPKTLITAQLGVVISLPEGKIALLGSIAALLPDPDAPLLSLRLDLIGEIDIPAGTLFMMASLYDSRLLATIELSGDMGLFLATKGQPYFLMSVGGYHPGFEPPALVPAPLHDLRRMTASVAIASNVSLTLTCYFAVTSNTVQFGSAVALEMSKKILGKTYYARGELGFDVLIRFEPFAIIAEIRASVGVYSGDKELLGVLLFARIEGPEPWYCTGRAEFKFFGIKVKFNVEVGGQAGPGSKPRVPLHQDVIDALSSPSAWEEVAVESGIPAALVFVDLAPVAESGRIWVRPDRQVRVTQGVAPLNRLIEVVGQGLPEAGDEMLEITSASLSGLDLSYKEEQDWFAPAQYEQMGQAEKLSRASFEEMCAGVSFGGSQLETTAHPDTLCTEGSMDYEESWCEKAEPRILSHSVVTDALVGGGAAAQALNAAVAPAAPQFQVQPVAFSVVAEVNGIADASVLQGQPASQGAALSASSGQRNLRVVSVASVWEEVA